MPRTDTKPTIPSDQDALLAREASRAIETQHVDMGSLQLQLANAGNDVTTVRLPEGGVAKVMVQASNSSHARQILELQYGRGRVMNLHQR